ncbi:MAG: hypothetical protein U5Q44_00955 [Dehalococcoidia bacterium]|nr:hypothetical protein [Dehalococcoidia bacterium]
MAARTRAQPRGTQRGGQGKKRSSNRTPWWKRKQFGRAEVAGIAIAAMAIAALPFVVDLGETLSGARDVIARTFGLGIFLLAGGVALAGVAIARRSYAGGAPFVRKAAGIAALLLFLWGALALNTADWSLGNVEFEEVSLGGELGKWTLQRAARNGGMAQPLPRDDGVAGAAGQPGHRAEHAAGHR